MRGGFKHAMPEGCPRARIRPTRRRGMADQDACLGDTLGEDATGMVIVDAGGHPMKYDALPAMQDFVAGRIQMQAYNEASTARLPVREHYLDYTWSV